MGHVGLGLFFFKWTICWVFSTSRIAITYSIYDVVLLYAKYLRQITVSTWQFYYNCHQCRVVRTAYEKHTFALPCHGRLICEHPHAVKFPLKNPLLCFLEIFRSNALNWKGVTKKFRKNLGKVIFLRRNLAVCAQLRSLWVPKNHKEEGSCSRTIKVKKWA